METEVVAPFADGEYRFWLGLPQILELERKCGDASILTIEERLRASIGVDENGEFVFHGGGSAMLTDVRETIRLGLIGGNQAVIDEESVEVGPINAARLVNDYVAPLRPLSEGVVLAWRILHGQIFGARLKKKADESAEQDDMSPSGGAS